MVTKNNNNLFATQRGGRYIVAVMIMKFTQRIIGAVLGLSLVSGISAGVFLSPQNNNIEPVFATEPEKTIRFYLDISGFTNWASDGVSFYLHTYNGKDNFHKATLSSTNVYFVDLTQKQYDEEITGSGYKFRRGNSDASAVWNASNWQTATVKHAIACKISGWDDTGSWTNAPTVEIVGGKNNVWSGDSAISLSFVDSVYSLSDGLQMYMKNVYLEADTQYKFTTNDSWWGFDKFDFSKIQGCFDGSGDGNVTVKKTGYYDFYYKINDSKMYVQESEITAAQKFSSSFLNETKTICEKEDFSTHESDLKDKWSDFSTAFGNLTLGAQQSFKTNTEVSEIVNARERYNYIVNKYSSLNDFAKLKSSGSNLVKSVIANNNVSLIMVITLVSSVLISAYSFIKIRKRKEN